MEDVKRIKLEVILLVKPRTFKLKKAKSCESRECHGIEGELFYGAFFDCIWFIVQYVNLTIPDLEDVDVTSY